MKDAFSYPWLLFFTGKESAIIPIIHPFIPGGHLQMALCRLGQAPGHTWDSSSPAAVASAALL